MRPSAVILACCRECFHKYNEDQVQVLVPDRLSTGEYSLYCSVHRVAYGSKDKSNNHANVTSACIRDRPDIKDLIHAGHNDPYSAEEGEDSSKSER